MIRKILLPFAAVMTTCAAMAWASVAFGGGVDSLVANLNAEQLQNIPPSAATISVTPTVAEDHEPIVAALDAEIPDGARVYGNGWTCSDGVQTLPVSATVQHIWATPGDHTISYTGVWVHTKTVTIVDKDGNDQTIESLLGIGMIDSSASFSVEGEQSPDPPKPDPPKPGPLPLGSPLVLILWESSTVTGPEAATKEALRLYCQSRQKLTFRVLDPQQPSENLWVPAARKEADSFRSKNPNVGPVLMAAVLPEDGSGSELAIGGTWSLTSDQDAAIAHVKEVFPDE